MSELRVGVDYLPASSHAPGIGRYMREMVRALVRRTDCPELRLFDIGGGPRAMEGAPLGLADAPARVRRTRRGWPRRAVAALGRVGLGADRLVGGVDVFQRALPDHPPVSSAAEVLPIAELPTLGSEQDQRLGLAARRAAGCIVFCSAYAEEVASRYGLDPERVHLATVGAEHWLRDLGERSPAPRPRVLVLGALRGQRRPLAALRGFEAWRAGGGDGELLFAGGPADAADELSAALATSPVRADVSWRRDLNEADMPALVAESRVLLHLSCDEGSPVTPLEACAVGAGLALERLPAFEEALGSAACWIPRDPQSLDIAEAIARASSAEHQQARPARKTLAGRYTWDRCAQGHIQAWNKSSVPRRNGHASF